MPGVSFQKLSAFSLASFELQAQSGGTTRYADAVYDLEDQISLSPQAMGLVGNYLSTSEVTHAPSDSAADLTC